MSDDVQDLVAGLVADVGHVRRAGLTDPQADHAEQRGQGVVDRAGDAGHGERGGELRRVQHGTPLALQADPGAGDRVRRVGREDAVDDGVPVELGDGAKRRATVAAAYPWPSRWRRYSSSCPRLARNGSSSSTEAHQPRKIFKSSV